MFFRCARRRLGLSTTSDVTHYNLDPSKKSLSHRKLTFSFIFHRFNYAVYTPVIDRIISMTCFLNCEDYAFRLSIHAYKRRLQRGIKQQHIAHLLRFGRKQYQNNAIYYSIGNKEIGKHAKACNTLKNMNGMHLVTALNGTVITLFRNRNFKLLRRK